MTELNRLLSDNLAVVVAVLGACVLVLAILYLVQGARLGRAVKAYRALVGDGSAGTLAESLDAQLGTVDGVSRRLTELNELHGMLEARTLSSLQHIGLVRFNPFDDTGSDQSFAIALLDERRDGIVLSSLHGRTNTRIFAKPVEGGTSRHALSAEESEAIRIAIAGTRSPQVAD